MNFRLTTILYVFALLAGGMAAFGPAIGIFLSVLVLLFWRFTPPLLEMGPSVWIFFVVFLVFLVGLLLPVMQSARESNRRDLCINHMLNIGRALSMYAKEHGEYPPAYTVDDDGKPLHSWRVLILPYLDRQDIYDAIDLSQPWDSPHNEQFASQISSVFQCPSYFHSQSGGLASHTNYLAVVGRDAGMRAGDGRSREEFERGDGANNTILIIEAPNRSVNWMEPSDLSIDEAAKLLSDPKVSSHRHENLGRFVSRFINVRGRAIFADGSVEGLGMLTGEQVRALLTIDGGESVVAREDRWRSATQVVVHWNRIVAAIVFLMLTLYPGIARSVRVFFSKPNGISNDM